MSSNLKTLKTCALIGAALDWAVAKCRGYNPTKREKHAWGFTHVLAPEKVCSRILLNAEGCTMNFCNFHPSTDWAHGGPIIEREKINVVHLDETLPDAMAPHVACCGANIDGVYQQCGPTPLVAAMRAYVASKLGGEVEIPESLLRAN